MSCNSDEQVPLPELWKGELDPAGLETYLVDLGRVGAITMVVKGAGATMAPDPRSTTLEEIKALSATGKALQLRYVWQDDEWWDTLMPTPAGYRLVRMRQPERPPQ